MQKLSGPITLIKKSFEIFFKKENLIYFLKIYSLLISFVVVISVLSNYKQAQAAALINLVYFFASFFISFVAINAIKGMLIGQIYSIKDLYLFGWKNLWKFLLLSVLTSLMIFGGIILLIIPGIVFSVWFYFSKFIFVDQKLGVIESLKKSKDLIKGRFWAVFGRLFVFGFFAGLAGIIFSTIPYIGSAIATIFGGLFVLPYYLLYRELVTVSADKN